MIRLLTQDDIPALVGIEKSCFSDPWSEKFFVSLMNNSCFTAFGYSEDGAVIGFICFFHIADEIEILNLAVSPESRRRGRGNALLCALEEYAGKTGAVRMFLEARKSNAAARSLYEKHGFQIIYIRKRYYDSPVEDAVVYEKDIINNADTRN